MNRNEQDIIQELKKKADQIEVPECLEPRHSVRWRRSGRVRVW